MRRALAAATLVGVLLTMTTPSLGADQAVVIEEDDRASVAAAAAGVDTREAERQFSTVDDNGGFAADTPQGEVVVDVLRSDSDTEVYLVVESDGTATSVTFEGDVNKPTDVATVDAQITFEQLPIATESAVGAASGSAASDSAVSAAAAPLACNWVNSNVFYQQGYTNAWQSVTCPIPVILELDSTLEYGFTTVDSNNSNITGTYLKISVFDKVKFKSPAQRWGAYHQVTWCDSEGCSTRDSDRSKWLTYQPQ